MPGSTTNATFSEYIYFDGKRAARRDYQSNVFSSTPSPVPYANLTNPQTLNLYAMVSDNPESFADLDGHMWFPALGGCADSALGSCNPESDPGSAGQYLTVKDLPHCWCGGDPTQNQTFQNQNHQQAPPLLPQNPSGLGPDWVDVTPQGGNNPNIPKRYRGPNGVEIEFDPANPNKSPRTFGGNDHWHQIDPATGKRLDGHLDPGDAVPSPVAPKVRDSSTAQKVATGVTIGLVAYGAYRVIRMLPSLAPPLWWTIPLNAAAP